MSDATDIYQQLAERHGHYCPMSTLGVRLGERTLRHLTGSETTAWQFRYLMQTCAADGIRIVLERQLPVCELQIEQQGGHCLYGRSDDGRELSVTLTDEALRLAAGYRHLSEDAKVERLEQLRGMAAEQLIDVTEGWTG